MAFLGSQRGLLTLIADTDMSDAQYRIVELTGTAHHMDLAAANQGFGVVETHPKSGEAGTVATRGSTKAQAGGAVAVGDAVAAANSGFATGISSGAAAGQTLKILGRALTSAASGSVFTLNLDVPYTVDSGAIVV